MITVMCQKCGQKYELDDSMAGNDAQCACGNTFYVQLPEPKDNVPIEFSQGNLPKTSRRQAMPRGNSGARSESFLQFKQPILSQIFTGLGIVYLLFAFILVAGFFIELMKTGFIMSNAMIYGGGFLFLLFQAVVFFGVSQIITAICETAYNTRIMLQEQLKK